ncbi:putative serine protease HhoA precursor [compost metagenome]
MSRVSKMIILLIGSLYLLISNFSISGADPPEKYDSEGLYAYAQPAIFYVRAFRADGTLKDVGTGFVIKSDGTALTAYHVIGGADRISCVFDSGTIIEGCQVVSQDETMDTAVLKLQPNGNSSGQEEVFPYINLRTSTLKHGEHVAAIGYPIKETKIITEGIVNSPRAPINGRDRILVSAQVVNGMSGGPVLDKYGEVIGLISGSLRTMNNIHLVVGVEDINKVMTSDSFKVNVSTGKGG